MGNSVMKLYEEKIEPMLPSMKKGVIHGDLNGKNIIVQQSENSAAIVGLIDFGDCVHSYYLFELAILVAHTMMSLSHNNRMELVAPVIKGYIDEFPLTQEELQCLYYAVLAILCTTGVKGEHVYATEPENMHMQHYIPHAWKLLSQLLPMSKDSVEASWNITTVEPCFVSCSSSAHAHLGAIFRVYIRTLQLCSSHLAWTVGKPQLEMQIRQIMSC